MIEALQIAGSSVTLPITAGVPLSSAIPLQANGEKARWVLLVSDGLVGFKPIQTGETPALAVMARLPEQEAMIVAVGGYDAIRFDSPSGTVNVTLTPLDNQ